jgi:glycosyltransferase involved in cell wall biosynthesis
MIAGAEAYRIRRSLESVSDWAAEIIVVINADVDDATEQIATELGAKAYREPWKGHIAQKNSAAEKATQKWLFGLDADEVVTPQLRDEIRALFAKDCNLTHDAYSVPRVTWYSGRWLRHGDWYPDRKTRLWKRGSAKWGGKNPHDKLITSAGVGKLRADLQHYSMDNLEHHARKALSYGTLFATQYPEDGARIGLFGLWLRPMWRFVRSYFIRLGFLDGWQGFAVARLIAFEAFIRYAKVRELQQMKDSTQ